MKTEELEKKFTNEIVSMLKPSFVQFVQYDMKDNTYTQCNGYGQTKDFTLSKRKNGVWRLLINDLLEDDGCIGIYLYSTKHIKHYIWIGTKVNNIKYNTHENHGSSLSRHTSVLFTKTCIPLMKLFIL